MHESEKWKWRHSFVSDSLCGSIDVSRPGSPSMGFSRQEHLILNQPPPAYRNLCVSTQTWYCHWKAWSQLYENQIQTSPSILDCLELFHSSNYVGLPCWIRPKRICPKCTRHGFNSWVGKIPWRRKWQPTPVFFSGEFHGQRSLTGYIPWGGKESDMTEWLTCNFHFIIDRGRWGIKAWFLYLMQKWQNDDTSRLL